MKIYNGTQEQVLQQLAVEHKAARQDQMNRKLAARQRKEEIEAGQEETNIRFCASFVKGKYQGC